MADTVASLDVVIDSSGAQSGAAQVKRSIEDIKASANDTAKSLKSIFSSLRNTIASIFGAYMVRNIARSFLEAARSAEDYRTSIRAVSSSIEEADATFDRIRKWAAVNPIDTDEAVGAFVRLRTAAVENSEGALNAIADLATVMHADMRDVASAVVTTETETLRNYGIILDRTGKQATIQMGNVRKTVEKDLDSIRAAIIEVIEESIGGSMQKAANTYSGIIDTMSGMWTDFQQDVMGISGKGPFDAVKNSLMDLRDEWEAFMKTEGYENLVQGVQGVLIPSINAASVAVKGLADAFMLVSSHATEVKAVVAAFAAYKGGLAITAAVTKFNEQLTLGMGLVPSATSLISRLGRAFTMIQVQAAVAGTKIGALKAILTGVTVSIKGLMAAIGPVGWAALAIGAGTWLTLRDNMKSAAEQAEITQKAIEKIDEQFSQADSKTITAELETVRAKLKELETQAKNTTDEMLRASTASFMSRNSILGGNVGGAVREIVDAGLGETNKLITEYRAQEKRLAELQKDAQKQEVVAGARRNSASSTSTSTKSAAELLVENIRGQIKYLYADGESFIPVLDQWIARSQTLSKDWRALKDLKQEIVDTAAERNPFSPENMLASMEATKQRMAELREESARLRQSMYDNFAWQNDVGLMSDGEYLNKAVENFERLKEEFISAGGSIENFLQWTPQLQTAFSTVQTAILESWKQYLEAGQLFVSGLAAQGLSEGNQADVMKQITDNAEAAKKEIFDLNEVTTEWITKFQDGVTNAIVSGENLGDVLSNIGQELLQLSLKSALFGENGKGGMFGGVFSWIGGLFGSAKGNVFGPSGHIAKYAKGGVPGALPSLNDYVNSIVSSPTLFKFARGVGMMGEGRGPEGIFPLARTSSGELGVRAIGAYGAGASAPAEYSSNINITIQNNGSGEMTDKQAAELGQMCREQVKMQVAEEMYKWHRTGIFRNAYAR